MPITGAPPVAGMNIDGDEGRGNVGPLEANDGDAGAASDGPSASQRSPASGDDIEMSDWPSGLSGSAALST
jgi:hypothetical protein